MDKLRYDLITLIRAYQYTEETAIREDYVCMCIIEQAKYHDQFVQNNKNLIIQMLQDLPQHLKEEGIL